MSEWFKDWFSSEEYLSVYQHRDNEDARKLLHLILKETNLTGRGTILDAACGAGRHSVNLASLGYRVTGFDLSRTLLKIAKRDAIISGTEVGFFCADLRNVPLKKKFDLVLNLFTSFGYFESDDENFLFIKRAFELLKDDSWYVLDFLNNEFLSRNLIPESTREINGKKITERRKIDSGRVVKEIIIENGSAPGTYYESVKLYGKDKIVYEFGKIGFKFVKAFGDYDGSDFNRMNSNRLILFFKK
jgi:SAM-dependent methyltransferase